jgi:hypothetical protein
LRISIGELALGRHSFARRIGFAIADFFQCLPRRCCPFRGLRFQKSKKTFSRDPHVTGDHYGARNLRLWQVILVWILAIDLLVTMPLRPEGKRPAHFVRFISRNDAAKTKRSLA